MTSSPTPHGFDETFPALYRAALAAALRVLSDRHASEEAAVEACFRAARQWQRVSSYATPWVVRVASNLAIDQARADRRHRPLVGHETAADTSGAADRLDVAAALRALPRRQREVVVLRYLGDFSEEDTAKALGISIGTVKSHAHRGLAALRPRLSETDLPVLEEKS